MIRKAKLGDLKTIVLFNKLMAYETEGLELNEKILTSGVKNALSDNIKANYWVYEIDNVVVGQAMVTKEWSDWRNGEIWWIQSVYVDKNYRKNKIFTSLYNHLKDLVALDENVVGLRLYVEKDNINAQNTYKKLGMEETYYRLYEWLK
jgi:ribosomal protein S18 acetylase RimI-like enzyme